MESHEFDENGLCECGYQQESPVAQDDTCEVHTVLCNDLFTCTVCGATLTEDDAKTTVHDEYDYHCYDGTYHYYGCTCGEHKSGLYEHYTSCSAPTVC